MFGRSKKPEKLADQVKTIGNGAATTPMPPGPAAPSAAAPAAVAPASASPAAGQNAVDPNGAAAAIAPDLSPDELKRRAAATKLVSAAFGQVVSVLMRAPQYKHFSLADLEWMVVPAMVTGQFSIVEAQSKKSGMAAPICVALWANVSPEVDARLSAAPGEPIRLKPQEWRSGDILWVIDAIGDPRAVTAVLKRLRENEWKGRQVKLRTRSKDGKPVVRVLEAQAGSGPAQSAG